MKPKIIRVPWEVIEDCCKIIAENIKGQDRNTLILGIKNGGVIPAMIVHKLLGTPYTFDIIEGYPRNAEYVYAKMNGYKNVLFIDDINDSGDTINNFGKLIKKACEMHPSFDPNFAFFTLFARKSSNAVSNSALVVDHENWFRFAWELQEQPKRNRDLLQCKFPRLG